MKLYAVYYITEYRSEPPRFSWYVGNGCFASRCGEHAPASGTLWMKQAAARRIAAQDPDHRVAVLDLGDLDPGLEVT